jgi:hypothetical protein
MADISYQGSKVIIGGKEIEFKFDLLSVATCQNVVVVLIDPDSYIGKEDIAHNLLGFDLNGNKLWEADYPQSYKSDYYWKIDTSQGLSASSFSSYNCELNPLTGKIQRANFYK